MNESDYVIIAAPIYREGAYIIDKFLSNQKEIQTKYPLSELILATREQDFTIELQKLIDYWGVKGKVILYETVKPDHACHSTWNSACGREAIRQCVLSHPKASHLLFIDADMTCDPKVIDIMKKEAEGYDVVASGYPGRVYGMITGGLGCMFISRNALEKIRFRCYEFGKRRVLDEGDVLEMDLFSMRLKFKRGFFLAIDHYSHDGSARHIEPHSVSLSSKMSNHLFVRFILIKASIILRCNIPGSLQRLLSRFF